MLAAYRNNQQTSMMLKVILLFVAVPASLTQACQTPLISALPESSFSATSAHTASVNASNVRFTTKEPWCPATDREDEYVEIDLGYALSVFQVEGKDNYLMTYTGEYSNNRVTWKKLKTDDDTNYDPDMGFFANTKAMITPPVQARYFRFKLPYFVYRDDEHGGLPCAEIELYGDTVPDDSVKSLGCYREKPRRRVMPVTFHSVRGVDTKSPDILAIYQECLQKAKEYQKLDIEVFGIKNLRRCVTTKTGKEASYSKYGKSSKCEVCSGKGIGGGGGGWSVFVYRIAKQT